MERWEIEATLSADRARLVEKSASLTDEELHRPAAQSQRDRNVTWSARPHRAPVAHRAGLRGLHPAAPCGAPNPAGLLHDDDGRERPRDEAMKGVHASTEAWRLEHHDKDLSAVLALGQEMRARRLELLSELSGEQLVEKLPGAPWGRRHDRRGVRGERLPRPGPLQVGEGRLGRAGIVTA